MSAQEVHESALPSRVANGLPSVYTASLDSLEAEGDVLRARRLPEDAMGYYNFAVERGGDAALLLDKLGLAALELRDMPWARAYFKRVVERDRRSADGWNNLGVVEYMNSRFAFAVADFEHAVSLDKGRAVYHSNLVTAYFAQEDWKGARQEIVVALSLDPSIFDGEEELPGVAARVLSSEHTARLSFERARLFARDGEEEAMLHSLARASEGGLDVRLMMRRDSVLGRFEKDSRVCVIVRNAQALRGDRTVAQSTPPLLKPLSPGNDR